MIIIQARTNSTRFPNKIMEEIGSAPIIRHIYDRCNSTGVLTVVAIPEKDAVIPYLKEEHIPYYEGSEEDVLARYYHCAKTYNAQWIYRVTADCPLLDITNILFLLRLDKSQLNWCEVTGIDGQEVEACSFGMLEKAHKEAQSKEDREHVFPWIKRQKLFLRHTIPYKAEKMSVDTQEDLERVRKIYADCHPSV